jgi:predicted ATP-binding protein involved in virulence
MTIKEIHDNVFNHLREKYPDLCFTLRKTDKGGRLSKGYWFLGNDTIISFSFWKGNDPLHKTPNICYSIKLDGSTLLEFVDWRDPKETSETMSPKRAFFEKIAKTFKMTALKGKAGAVNKWIRDDSNTDYLKTLDHFIQGDKVLLDTLISVSEVKTLLAPINKGDFEKSLQVMGRFQEKPTPIKPKIVEPLRLKSLKLTNISHFESLEIDLSSNVTCLIGENGSGKTTLLRTIAFGLVGYSNENFIREGIEKLDYQLTNFLKIKKAQNQQIEYESKGHIELFYNQNKKNHIEFKLLQEGVDDNGILHSAGEVNIDDSNSDFDALDESNHFKNLVVGFSQSKSLSGKAQKEANPKKASVMAIYNLICNEGDFSFDNVQDWIAQAFNADLPQEERLQMMPILKKAFEMMTSIIGEPIELGAMNPQRKVIPLIKTPDAPNGIPLNLVSQGYENLIGWVGYFVKRMSEVTPIGQDFTKTPAICLIDEIDTYLHPKWQRNILSVLVDTFPNTQFIVTTHSPLIITHLKNTGDTVTVYRIAPNRAEKIQASGQDIRTALRMHFGVERRPLFYQDQIDDLFLNFEKWEAQEKGVTLESLEKQLNELVKILGETDPDVETATRILEALKIPLD